MEAENLKFYIHHIAEKDRGKRREGGEGGRLNAIAIYARGTVQKVGFECQREWHAAHVTYSFCNGNSVLFA